MTRPGPVGRGQVAAITRAYIMLRNAEGTARASYDASGYGEWGCRVLRYGQARDTVPKSGRAATARRIACALTRVLGPLAPREAPSSSRQG